MIYLPAFIFSACSFIFALSASSSCQYSCCFPSFPIFLILSIVLIPFSLILISHRQLSSLCHHVLTCCRLLSCLLSYGSLRTCRSHRTCQSSSYQQVLLPAKLELLSGWSICRTCNCSNCQQGLLLVRLELVSGWSSQRTCLHSSSQQVLLLATQELKQERCSH